MSDLTRHRLEASSKMKTCEPAHARGNSSVLGVAAEEEGPRPEALDKQRPASFQGSLLSDGKKGAAGNRASPRLPELTIWATLGSHGFASTGLAHLVFPDLPLSFSSAGAAERSVPSRGRRVCL